MLHDLLFRLRALFRRPQAESELEAELQLHLELEADKLRAQGLSPAEADRQARLRFGGLDLTREQCRDARGLSWLEDLGQDLRYAARTLRKSPAFLLTAVASLAIGIGANTAVFGVAHALLFRGLPVPDAGQVVAVTNAGEPNTSFPNYRDIQARATAFDSMSAYRIAPVNLQTSGAAQRVWGLLVTGNYFQMLRIEPALGRFFTPAEDRLVNASPYAVISHECWQSRFGSDPNIIGRQVRINLVPYTILGVAPRGFIGTDHFYRSDIWLPMSMQPQVEGNSWLEQRTTNNIWIAGRLRPGASRAQANANLRVISDQLIREHPGNQGLRLWVTTPGLAGDELRAPTSAFAGGVLFLAGLVLLAACANLANLLIARAVEREHELSIRVSIGAGQGRIARQLLTEALLLSLLGGAGGVVLAQFIITLLNRARFPFDFPFRFDLALDWQVLAFSISLAVLTGLLFGLAPAFQAWRLHPSVALAAAPQRGGSRRAGSRELLLTVQVALCALLVTSSLVALRGLNASLRTPLGFRTEGIAVAGLDLTVAGYSQERSRQFQQDLVRAAANLPGVTAAAYASNLPLGLDQSTSRFFQANETEFRPNSGMPAPYFKLSPGYFATMGTRLLAGREFAPSDNLTAPAVAIVNRTFAMKMFGHPNAVGRYFRQRHGGPVQIIGVAEDGKYSSLTELPRPVVFWPILQKEEREMMLIARSTRPEAELAADLRRLIANLNPDLPAYGVGSLNQFLAVAYFPAYAAVWALGAFGLLAVIVAGTGVYGLSSFTVAKRSRELGIRRAIGARASQILITVLGRSGLSLCLGSGLGLLASVFVARLLSEVVYGASSTDPVVIASAVGFMLLIGIVSALGPARRALRLDPIQVLRQE
jgi:predicted permease